MVRQKRLVMLGAVMVLALAIAFMPGCRHTDALTQIIYNQDVEIVDYDNPDKLYIPKQNADEQNSVVPPEQSDDTNDDEQREQVIPERNGGQDSQVPAPAVVPGTSMDDHEAGNASEPDADASPTGQTDSGQVAGQKDDASGQNAGDNADNSAENQGDKVNGQDPSSPNVSGPNGPGTIYDARNGVYEELPKLAHVAAAGQLAEVVAVLGGADALVAAPESYTSNANFSTLYGNVATGFVGDGNGYGSALVDAIIAAAPEGVLVPDGSLALDDGSYEQIIDAGINVVILPSMNSASGIRTCVDQVGSILTGSGNVRGVSARVMADSYLQFYDKTMSAALSSHGGSFAVSTFDWGTDGAVGSGVVTLFIDGWDGTASVNVVSFPAGNVLCSDAGVAYTEFGYASGPLATFMAAGGAVNNTMYWDRLSWVQKDILPVLQFDENFVVFNWAGGQIPLSGGTGVMGGGHRVLMNAADDSGCLGQGNFPAVIARTNEIAYNLDVSRNTPGSLYYPGTEQAQGVGTFVDGEFMPLYSTFGYAILVNPAGWLGNWADGGMEGVLEAAWVAWEFQGLPESDLRGLVADYYNDFYGAQLDPWGAEVSAIIGGAYA